VEKRVYGIVFLVGKDVLIVDAKDIIKQKKISTLCMTQSGYCKRSLKNAPLRRVYFICVFTFLIQILYSNITKMLFLETPPSCNVLLPPQTILGDGGRNKGTLF
jgi:hypothetical protein